jgi:hypothetical protein
MASYSSDVKSGFLAKKEQKKEAILLVKNGFV